MAVKNSSKVKKGTGEKTGEKNEVRLRSNKKGRSIKNTSRSAAVKEIKALPQTSDELAIFLKWGDTFLLR